MLKTINEYLKIIESYSDFIKGDELKFCGIDWWPLVKIQLAHHLNMYRINNPASKRSRQTDILKISRSISYFKNELYYYYLKQKLFSDQKNDGNIVLTFSINRNTINLSGKLVNQYTDPFLDYFSLMGIKYSVFDISDWRNNKPDLSSLKFHYRNRIIREFNRDNEFSDKLKVTEDFFRKNVSSSFHIYNLLANTIINNQATYLAYYDFLKNQRFNTLLCYNYYNSDMMAVNRAARELGINTVEYQHSIISSYHFAYSGWDERISKSEYFFPAVFWVWRECDARLIESSFSFLPSLKVIKGGNVFISACRKHTARSQSDKIKILITLQGTGLPDYIQKYISEEKNIFWYLRLHPRYPMDKSMIEMLHNKCPDNTDLEKANTLSLYELFSEVNYHMTNSSGSALEAQSFGVQNIIFGEDGYNAYKENISNQSFFYINNKEELDQILINKRISNTNIDVALSDKDQIREAIISLFKGG